MFNIGIKDPGSLSWSAANLSVWWEETPSRGAKYATRTLIVAKSDCKGRDVAGYFFPECLPNSGSLCLLFSMILHLELWRMSLKKDSRQFPSGSVNSTLTSDQIKARIKYLHWFGLNLTVSGWTFLELFWSNSFKCLVCSTILDSETWFIFLGGCTWFCWLCPR